MGLGRLYHKLLQRKHIILLEGNILMLSLKKHMTNIDQWAQWIEKPNGQ